MKTEDNTGLIKTFLVLGIICFVAFLTLWAFPTFLEGRAQAREERRLAAAETKAERQAAANSPEAAAKYLQKYVLTEMVAPSTLQDYDYPPVRIASREEAVLKAKDFVGDDRANEIATAGLDAVDNICYFFYVEPVQKSDGSRGGWYTVITVYKTSLDGEWKME